MGINSPKKVSPATGSSSPKSPGSAGRRKSSRNPTSSESGSARRVSGVGVSVAASPKRIGSPGSPKLAKKMGDVGKNVRRTSSAVNSLKKSTGSEDAPKQLVVGDSTRGVGGPIRQKSVARVLDARREAQGKMKDDDRVKRRDRQLTKPKLGCLQSLKKKLFPAYVSLGDIGMNDTTSATREKLGFTDKQVQKVYAVYQDIDVDNSNSIDYRGRSGRGRRTELLGSEVYSNISQ